MLFQHSFHFYYTPFYIRNIQTTKDIYSLKLITTKSISNNIQGTNNFIDRKIRKSIFYHDERKTKLKLLEKVSDSIYDHNYEQKSCIYQAKAYLFTF